MADSQDKLTPSDEAKLAELEKQLAKEKVVSPSAKKVQGAAAANKSAEKASTNFNDSLTKESSYKSKAAVRPDKPATKSNSKTGVLWFFTLINLLLLACIIAAGYWVWLQWQTQNQQQTDAIAAQQTSMQQQQASLDQQQNNIAESLASTQLAKSDLAQQNQRLQSSLQSLTEELQLTSAQVQINQRNLADVSGRRPADWLLAEADYLVRMAGRKLWLEHDVKTAIMMLQSADSRIQDLDDPSLLPLQAKLAEDLQTLQQVLSSNVVREKMQGLRDLSRMRIGLHTWREKIALYKALVNERSQQRLAQRDSLQTLGVDQRQQTLTLERDEKQKQLENILAKKDYLALASGETAELLEILDRARGNIETLKAAGESVSYEEEAYQRYRGILLWRASETYSEQVWMAKKHLRGLDQALLSLGERKQTIDKVLTEAPDILPWLDKLDQKSLAIDEHNARVERAISRAEGALRQELLAALKQQRQHLKSYLAQTRLAIARLLDAALRAQES
ncbi:uroporphyrinogen-III C-methyltransferase [uncultured Paraglaciecola sp.]|uniref:uroporphyrinogen-III C-methyltransferase n=1 Tax=uncultured Paraglaciecola sp. TaxID=1765024 RepID=UPI0025D9FBF2|nr:uroporphyrinogen-III C-methyltransferase [uncultured Paraglaciecola sp.]